MSSREKRRKSSPSPTPPPPKSSPIPSLPYDLVLICVARISRLYYPTLSLVSKSFRSLVSSPELYKTRSLLGFTETCLYVCLQSHRDEATWFTLCLKPGKTLKTGSSGYALARVHVPSSPPSRFRNVVAVGSNIYNIALPRVPILDCKSHTWVEAPSLPVQLSSLSTSVLGRKIYVAGMDSSLKNSFEVFDTETQIWDSVSTKRKESFIFKEKTVSIDGKFHAVTNEEVVAYDPKEGKWEMVGGRMGWCMFSDAYCVIGNVLYSAFDGVFRWYDTEERIWSFLHGLVGLPRITRDRVIRLADYGGKMMVVWDQAGKPSSRYKEIWCAEIALERRHDDDSENEIWGKVEWFDRMLKIKINTYYQVEKVLSTTV
ncbi:F-box/kelch-repeat protein At4g39550 isoform X1 [Brassica rapa]|uniref:F-box domain-containing protein n=2 Tax=Brassica campestris TaxID=3711 RepID=M4F4Z6_BRACM|nr:F-box/kelch-repeat protein At4g39550 isoform X1 [Brassica rapa]